MKTHHHRFRDLVQRCLTAEANVQILPVRPAKGLLDRDLLQREPDDNLNNYIANLNKPLSGGAPVQARIVESKLLAVSAPPYPHNLPFVTRERSSQPSWKLFTVG